MKLKKTLPPNRSFEQIQNHYLVEKAIADRIKVSSLEDRKLIYATMYDELFGKVPDHPRLTRRDNEQLTLIANKNKLATLSGLIDQSTVFAEFGPGDCRFAMEVAKYVNCAYGIDISDQRNPNHNAPDNFKLIIYDGYSLEGIEENSIDILFSDQIIEHFHPEETQLHFQLAYRILKKGGKYIFITPHAFRGPHDVSAYFSDEPECFHLKEWTYAELHQILSQLGYSKLDSYWCAKSIKFRMPNFYFEVCEKVLGLFPRQYIRVVAKYLIPNIFCATIK
ncbi:MULTISPECIES: class I SAM-dependent methyltransferase [unclassified Microcoleus]|uniref:class I SAM-dependent methyltransferase n=1 Tax=unclassified Microcoleus TaxID=2642155 RepID=UPI002FD6B5C6